MTESLLLLLFHPSAFLPISLSVSQSTHQLFSLSIAAPSHLSEVIYSRLSPLHGFSAASPTHTHTKNMSTKNPANMQSLFGKDSLTMQPAVPPCLLFFYLCPTFLHPPLPPCTCTFAAQWASHTFALKKK